VVGRGYLCGVCPALDSGHRPHAGGDHPNATTQHGETIWPFDSFHNAQGTEYALTGTWLQYLYAGQSVRLVTYRQTGSSSVLRGGAGGVETYFSISGLGTLT